MMYSFEKLDNEKKADKINLLLNAIGFTVSAAAFIYLAYLPITEDNPFYNPYNAYKQDNNENEILYIHMIIVAIKSISLIR